MRLTKSIDDIVSMRDKLLFRISILILFTIQTCNSNGLLDEFNQHFTLSNTKSILFSENCKAVFPHVLKSFQIRGSSSAKSYFSQNYCFSSYVNWTISKDVDSITLSKEIFQKSTFTSKEKNRFEILFSHIPTNQRSTPEISIGISQNTIDFFYEQGIPINATLTWYENVEPSGLYSAKSKKTLFKSLINGPNHRVVSKRVVFRKDSNLSIPLDQTTNASSCIPLYKNAPLIFDQPLQTVRVMNTTEKFIETSLYCLLADRETVQINFEIVMPFANLLDADFIKRTLVYYVSEAMVNRTLLHLSDIVSHYSSTQKVMLLNPKTYLENAPIDLVDDTILLSRLPSGAISFNLALIADNDMSGDYKKCTVKLIPLKERIKRHHQTKIHLDIHVTSQHDANDELSSSLEEFLDDENLIFAKSNPNLPLWNYIKLSPVNGRLVLMEKISCHLIYILNPVMELKVDAVNIFTKKIGVEIVFRVKIDCPVERLLMALKPYYWIIYGRNAAKRYVTYQSVFNGERVDELILYDVLDTKGESVMERAFFSISNEMRRIDINENVPFDYYTLRVGKPMLENEELILTVLIEIIENPIQINYDPDSLNGNSENNLKWKILKRKKFRINLNLDHFERVGNYQFSINEIQKSLSTRSRVLLLDQYRDTLRITNENITLYSNGNLVNHLRHNGPLAITLFVLDDYAQEFEMTFEPVPGKRQGDNRSCPFENSYHLTIFNLYSDFKEFKKLHFPLLIGNLYKWSTLRNENRSIHEIVGENYGLYIDEKTGNLIMETDLLARKFLLEKVNNVILSLKYKDVSENLDIVCNMSLIHLQKKLYQLPIERVKINIFENIHGSILYKFPREESHSESRYYVKNMFYLDPNEEKTKNSYPVAGTIYLDEKDKSLRLCDKCSLDRETLVNGMIRIHVIQETKSSLLWNSSKFHLFEITLVVKDVNDVPPAIVNEMTEIEMFEDLDSVDFKPRRITSLWIRDPDLYTGNEMEDDYRLYKNNYSLEIEPTFNLNGSFKIDPLTYDLMQMKPLDRESLMMHDYANVFLPSDKPIDEYSSLIIKLAITISDGSLSNYKGVRIFTLILKNIDDTRPQLVPKNLEILRISFATFQPGNTLVKRIEAADLDSVLKNVSSINYEIMYHNDDFYIDHREGTIFSKRILRNENDSSFLVRCSKAKNPSNYITLGIIVETRHASSIKKGIFFEDTSLDDIDDSLHSRMVPIHSTPMANVSFYSIPVEHRQLDDKSELWFEQIAPDYRSKLSYVHPKTGEIFPTQLALASQIDHIGVRVNLRTKKKTIRIFYFFQFTKRMAPITVSSRLPLADLKFDSHRFTTLHSDQDTIQGLVLLPSNLSLPMSISRMDGANENHSIDAIEKRSHWDLTEFLEIFSPAKEVIKLSIDAELNQITSPECLAIRRGLEESVLSNDCFSDNSSLIVSAFYFDNHSKIKELVLNVRKEDNADIELPHACQLRYDSYRHDISDIIDAEIPLKYVLLDEERCYFKSTATYYLINGHDSFRIDSKSGRLRREMLIRSSPLDTIKAKVRIKYFESSLGQRLDRPIILNADFELKMKKNSKRICSSPRKYFTLTSNEPNEKIGSIIDPEQPFGKDSLIFLGEEVPDFISINPYNGTMALLSQIPISYLQTKSAIDFTIRISSETFKERCHVRILLEFCYLRPFADWPQENLIFGVTKTAVNDYHYPIAILPKVIKCLNNANTDDFHYSLTGSNNMNRALTIDQSTGFILLKNNALIGMENRITLELSLANSLQAYEISIRVIEKEAKRCLSTFGQCLQKHLSDKIIIGNHQEFIGLIHDEGVIQLIWIKENVKQFKCLSSVMYLTQRENIPNSFIGVISLETNQSYLETLRLEVNPKSDKFLLTPDKETSQIGLSTTESLDRETEESYTIRIYDANTPNEHCIVELKVTDDNDNRPMFLSTLYNISLPEDLLPNQIIDSIDIRAVDRDNLALYPLTYSFVGDFHGTTTGPNSKRLTINSKEFPFKINSKSGDISITTRLNYEEIKEYHASIRVDDGIGSHETSLQVNILNINNNAPIWLSNAQEDDNISKTMATSHMASSTKEFEFVIDAEQARYTLFIGQIEAMDPDGGKIEYDHEGSECLAVDKLTGQISFKSTFCVGTSDTHQGMISAKDSSIQDEFLNSEIAHQIHAIIVVRIMNRHEIIVDFLDTSDREANELIRINSRYAGFNQIPFDKHVNELNLFSLDTMSRPQFKMVLGKITKIREQNENRVSIAQTPYITFNRAFKPSIRLFYPMKSHKITIVKQRSRPIVDQSIYNHVFNLTLNNVIKFPHLIDQIHLGEHHQPESRYVIKKSTLSDSLIGVELGEGNVLNLYLTKLMRAPRENQHFELMLEQEICCFPNGGRGSIQKIVINLLNEQSFINTDKMVYYENYHRRVASVEQDDSNTILNDQISPCISSLHIDQRSIYVDIVKGNFCLRPYDFKASPKQIIPVASGEKFNFTLTISNMTRLNEPIFSTKSKPLLHNDYFDQINSLAFVKNINMSLEVTIEEGERSFTVSRTKSLYDSKTTNLCIDNDSSMVFIVTDNCRMGFFPGYPEEKKGSMTYISMNADSSSVDTVDTAANYVTLRDNCKSLKCENSIKCLPTILHRPTCVCRLGFSGASCEVKPAFSLKTNRSFKRYKLIMPQPLASDQLTFTFILHKGPLQRQTIFKIENFIDFYYSPLDDAFLFVSPTSEVKSVIKVAPMTEHRFDLTFDQDHFLVKITNVDENQFEYIRFSMQTIFDQRTVTFGHETASFAGCIINISWPRKSSVKELEYNEIKLDECISRKVEETFQEQTFCTKNWNTVLCQCPMRGAVFDDSTGKCGQKITSYKLLRGESLSIEYSRPVESSSTQVFSIRFKVEEESVHIFKFQFNPRSFVELFVKNSKLTFVMSVKERESRQVAQNLTIKPKRVYHLACSLREDGSLSLKINTTEIELTGRSYNSLKLHSIERPKFEIASGPERRYQFCFSDLIIFDQPISLNEDKYPFQFENMIFGENFVARFNQKIDRETFFAGCSANICSLEGICDNSKVCQENSPNVTLWGDFVCTDMNLAGGLFSRFYTGLGLPFAIGLLICVGILVVVCYFRCCICHRENVKLNTRKLNNNLHLNGANVPMSIHKNNTMLHNKNDYTRVHVGHCLNETTAHMPQQQTLGPKGYVQNNYYPLNETISTSSDNNQNDNPEHEYSIVSDGNNQFYDEKDVMIPNIVPVTNFTPPYMQLVSQMPNTINYNCQQPTSPKIFNQQGYPCYQNVPQNSQYNHMMTTLSMNYLMQQNRLFPQPNNNTDNRYERKRTISKPYDDITLFPSSTMAKDFSKQNAYDEQSNLLYEHVDN